ncbi:hypothetical protein QJS66_08190 [Kocuria rhizophila]|nr:hypothetical protein QJS66_08190 [Kocuria rhizophila]
MVFDETYYLKDAYSLLLHRHGAAVAGERRTRASSGDDPRGGEPAVLPWCARHWASGSSRSAVAVRRGQPVRLAVLRRAVRHADHRPGLVGGLAAVPLGVPGHDRGARDGPGRAAPRGVRLALLDIFLMFFLLLAFVFALLDRDDGRRRLVARWNGSALARGWGCAGGGWPRAWRAVRRPAVKWNALFSIAALASWWRCGT